MDERYDQPLDLRRISGEACLSRYHFIRAFRRTFLQTPHQYLVQRRIEQAKHLLATTDLTVTEVCLAVGFQSLGSFSSLFRRSVGLSPRQYRSQETERWQAARRRIPACYLIMAGLQPLRARN
jgi:AraC-like DNA-binding protein